MKDIEIIRGLARRYVELSWREENREHYERCKAVNELQPQRPPVWIDEIPWHEFNDHPELALHCGDDDMRKMEWFFREKMFRWEYFKSDMVLPHYYPLMKCYSTTGNGLHIQDKRLSTDERNNIVSHQYIDQLDTEEKVNAIRIPVVTAYPEKDTERLARLREILSDILPVRLCGVNVHHSPWDEISMMRGVEPALIDILERPELIHQTMEALTQVGLGVMEQYEQLGLLESQPESLHCTPSFTNRLQGEPGHTLLKDVWFRGMAQMFSSVSPAVFEEFEFNYMKRLAEKCGLVYYGCCEPLDNFLPILKQLPNLRKLGISPWANIQKCAEQIGGGYVCACKPNPAFVSGTLDEEAVKREIKGAIEACIAFGCPYEFVLKDISTAGGKLQNLIRWNDTVQHSIDLYYK